MRFFLLGMLATGCGEKTPDSDTPALPGSDNDLIGDTGSIETIEATVRILSATSGAGVSDVAVQTTNGESETTSTDGTAMLHVDADSTFALSVQGEGAIDHLLFGPTADADFEFITFLATESLLGTVNSYLGTTTTPDTGIVVVGIDYDDLSPAVGATASLDSGHDGPWVLGSTLPAIDDTVPAGGMGMVAFPNVAPGDVSVSVVPPAGASCTAFPGGGEMPRVPVLMNQVTVVAFHCR